MPEYEREPLKGSKSRWLVHTGRDDLPEYEFTADNSIINEHNIDDIVQALLEDLELHSYVPEEQYDDFLENVIHAV